MEVTTGQFRVVRRMIKKFPSAVLEFSAALLGLFGVWHCHEEVIHLLPVGLEVFCEMYPKASTELPNIMQNSYFHYASENWLTVLRENP
jgi:hypothetical protein